MKRAIFVDCSGPIKNPVLLAKAKDTVQFMRPLTEILHLHLALTDKVDEMRISWVSGSEKTHTVKWWNATEKNPPVFETHNEESYTYSEVSTTRWALIATLCLIKIEI